MSRYRRFGRVAECMYEFSDFSTDSAGRLWCMWPSDRLEATFIRMCNRGSFWRPSLWRAFHRSFPAALRENAKYNVWVSRRLAQFDAEDACAAASSAIDNLLASHGITTSKPS